MRWCLNRWRGRAALLVVLSALASPAFAGPDDGPTKDAAKLDKKIPQVEDAGKLVLQGKIDEAYKMLQSINVKDYPDLPPARLMLARLMLASQIRELQPRVRLVMEMAISENSDHPVVYLQNANLALAEGRVTEAILNSDRALQLGAAARWTPEQKKEIEAGGHAVLAQSYEQRADWAGARTHLAALLKNDPKNGQMRVRLAKVMFLLLKPEDKTSDVYAELTQAYKDDSKLVDPPDVHMGRFWADKGDSTEARKAFEKAVKADPTNLRVHVAYADWLMQKNEYTEAKARIDAAAKIKADDLEVMKFQGLVARVLKDYPESVKIFKQVLNTAPNDTVARNHLALALADMGGEQNLKLAVGYAELNYQANPKTPEALATLGYVYYKSKEMDKAMQALQEALRVSNNRLSPDTAYYLALCLGDRGKEDEAKTLLKEAITATGLFVYQKEAKDLKERLDKTPPRGNAAR
jgi:tetratricopeptide (TPR) repeat protein